MQHTFLYISLPLSCTTSRNFLDVTRCLEEMSYVFSFNFFSLRLIFTLHWGHFSFCHRRYKIFLLSFQQKMSPLFFICPSRSLSPFVSLSFAGLCLPLSLFLCVPLALYSKVVDMTINLSLIHTETISAFRFRLHWLFNCLCFTRRGWLCDFPLK